MTEKTENLLDHRQQNDELKKALKTSIYQLFPIENAGKTIVLNNISIEDNLNDDDFPVQKDAKIKRKSWQMPIYADFEILDDKGKVVSKQAKLKIGNLPKITNRFTTIIEGNEYQTVNQLRRKSGIYSRIKRNGELEAEFNLSKGKNFKMQLDPISQLFFISYANRKYRLWTLLTNLGMLDTEIEKVWGRKLLDINKKGALNTEVSEMNSIYEIVYGKEPKNYEEVRNGLQNYFNNLTEVDSAVTKMTLGVEFSNANAEALLTTSKKLLNINKGEQQPDDRDSLLYKRIYSVEDLVASYFEKQAPMIQNKLKRSLGLKDKIKEIISSSTFGEPIKKFFTVGDLSSTPAQTNPVEIVNVWRKTTPMGTGGIKSHHAITMETRDVQPTHLGFLDSINTPECNVGSTQIFTSVGWKRLDEITKKDLIACNINGHMEFHNPEKVQSFKYNDYMYGFKNKKIDLYVTGNHRIWSRPLDKHSNLDYSIEKAKDLLNKSRLMIMSHFAYEGDQATTHFELNGIKYPIEVWAEFMGWFLSEGSKPSVNRPTIVKITQLDEKNCNQIKTLLTKLDFKWSYDTKDFTISNKNLNNYLQQFGYCNEKFIPEYLFNAPLAARERLLDSLMKGDGRRTDPRNTLFKGKQQVYTTTSEQLAHDVQRLMITLGFPTSIKVYPDNREERYLDVWEVRILAKNETQILASKGHTYKEKYKGTVYGVTVPGGLIYVKEKNSCPVWTGNSGKVGVTVGLASEVHKRGNDMVTLVIDKNSKIHQLDPIQFYNSKIGFPDQYENINGKITPSVDKIKSMYKGQNLLLDPSEVEYYLRSPRTMFSFPSNLVPFLANTQANRAGTGARMIGQAIGLDNREPPLVRTYRDRDTTYEDLLGGYLNPKLDESETGTVENISDNYIDIKLSNGKKRNVGLYNNFPLNQDGFLNSTVLVKPGDKVNSKSILTESNFSKGNTLSMGKNLTVAYMPYKGYNFEDGAVITEDAAKKLSNTMLHRENIFFSPKLSKFNKEKFMAWYPEIISPDNNKKLDSSGIIKVGQTIAPGEVLAAFLIEKEPDEQDIALKKLNKFIFSVYSKSVKTWEEEEPGIVTDVNISGRNIDIYIKATHPFKEGDKLSGRYGNKYIVTKIIPTSDAPYRPNGDPVEIMLSPHSVPSRMNIGQILESAAGKIAEKTGKPYIVNNFEKPNQDMANKIYTEMKALKIEPNEILTDGKTGQKIKNPIFVGKQYIMKLRHTVSKKEGVHNYGVYDVDGQPAGKGAQKIGIMDTYAYLAHAAKNNLYEMANIKGRKNEEYWRDLQFGLPPAKPSNNFIFEKMISYLKGAGINVNKKGNKLQILPLTDSDITSLSNGEIKDPGAMLIGKNLTSRKDGLFDNNITGGVRGTQWGHINLFTRIPNPMFEDAIMKSLDLTENAYEAILSGKQQLNGKTGHDAIISELKEINVNKRIKELRAQLKIAPPTNVNKLNTKIRYMEALQDLKMDPIKAYTLSKIPIIPPVFRPVYPLPSGDLVTSDINKHYHDVGLINSQLKNGVNDLPDKEKLEGVEKLYNSIKAMQGFIDPITYSKDKYKGFLQELGKMKTGLIHGKAWSHRQDVSGRSTITVEPDLGLNEVGIPREFAYTAYKPFILRSMKESGIKATQALKQYEDKSPSAMLALENVMKDRPVILNRAPSLHKHSVQAFRPILTSGKSIRLNPLVVKGFNADFDGDTMSVMVPIGKEAVEEARQMVPSKILFKHGDNSLMPGIAADYLYGLYELSKTVPGKIKRRFSTIMEAKNSDIPWVEIFSLNGKDMTIGQYMINAELPTALKDYTRALDKKIVNNILTELGKKYPTFVEDVFNSWKDLGASYSYINGNTISITDFAIDHSYRDNILKKEMPAANLLKGIPRAEAMNNITRRVQVEQDKELSKNNNIYKMLTAGSFSKPDSVRQILSMPGVLNDIENKPLPIPVTTSYGEGLDTSSYFNTLYSARKGTVDRSVNTQQTGALTKDILNVARRFLVVETDCGTKDGIEFDINDKNLIDRALLVTIPKIGKRNDLINTDVLMKAKLAGLQTITARSPLTCDSVEGVCQMCYGLMPNGQLPPLGTNVGILDSEAITERATQLTMQCTADSFTIDETGKFTILSNCYTQSHAPHDTMVALYMEDGGCMLVQNNHPMWINGNKEKLVSEINLGIDTVENKLLFIKELYNSTEKDDSISSLPPYLMGCIAGDGSYRYYSDKPEVARAIIVTNVRDDLKYKLNTLYPGSIRDEDYQIYNTELANKVKSQIRPKAKTKALLLDWSKLSKDWIGAFISGLVDTDGCITRGVIKIYSTSYTLLDQVRTMSNILDIHGTLRLEKRRKHQKTQQFSLTLMSSDNIKFWLRESLKINKDFISTKYTHKEKYNKDFVIIKKKKTIPVQSDIEIVYDRKTHDKKFITGTYINHNTFHTGGSALGGGGIQAGIPRIEQLIKLPERLSGKATLSEIDGKIKSIVKNQTGGYNVTVDNKMHVVPGGRRPIIDIGQTVNAGDPLSDGVIKPQELSTLKSHLDAQKYMVNELSNVYGGDFYKKTFETAVKAISDNADITKAPDDSGFLRGDSTTISYLNYLNRLRQKEGLDKIEYTPYFKSVQTSNTDSDDWLTKVTTNRVKAALTTGAAKGQYANLKGKDPIPAYIYGEEFGKGTDFEKGEFY